MNNDQSSANNRQFVRNSVEAAISIGLVVILVYWCFDIIKPFIPPIIWGIILAVAIYPLYLRLQVIMRGHQSFSAVLCTLFLLVLVIVPTVLLTDSLVKSVQYLSQNFGNGTLTIPPPPESVGSWPFVGKPLAEFWRLASGNIDAALQQIAPHLKVVGSWLFTTAEHTGLGILQFIVAIIISGFLLPRANSGKRFTLLIADHFVGEQGEPLIDLAQATVRSVALGILGVAAIQSIFAGLGFIVAGVPAAGLWALLCLLLSLLQIGIALVVTPIIIYMFYHADTFTAVAFLIWIIPVTFIDTFLKPILLSRCVKTPMVVIFLGAIGGFLQSGIVGLFTGAVILSLSYALLMSRIKEISMRSRETSE